MSTVAVGIRGYARIWKEKGRGSCFSPHEAMAVVEKGRGIFPRGTKAKCQLRADRLSVTLDT